MTYTAVQRDAHAFDIVDESGGRVAFCDGTIAAGLIVTALNAHVASLEGPIRVGVAATDVGLWFADGTNVYRIDEEPTKPEGRSRAILRGLLGYVRSELDREEGPILPSMRQT